MPIGPPRAARRDHGRVLRRRPSRRSFRSCKDGPRLTHRFCERNSVSVTCRLQVAPPKGQVLVVASTLGAGDGLKVLFTNVAMTARSAAEGGSMLVMNVPGDGHNVCHGS